VHTIKTYLPLLGRLLLSSIFIYEGIAQLGNPGGAAKYFAQVSVPFPDIAIWISIVIQLVGGFAVLFGFETRWAAALLAVFCLGTAFAVHLPAADTANIIHFFKNLVMAGGFVYVIGFGAGAVSVDGADDAGAAGAPHRHE